ncbi:NAD(P)-dependent oxidoreductase [Streptomyces hesseae]|uniref:NAD(P)-binding domain-containing protein n=1 Tax=Streptomyces hesseae TaxID=3075519 RepID=A0ABU2SYC8_9ACTN|nr:NAD(P)-binding domain-containing protein [Streptomyces sp. DSM 40473]MDT0453981.1 NAD(P)-binding domain-containing protein [Streptomyces sp. DSM 40473]
MSKQSVTVIGLGPMGQAMVGAFLAAGHRVTVWNRTASKADELVAKGAVLAPTVADALAANELIVLSLTDYEAMYTILEPAAASLSGKVIANLSSDTPDKARAAAEWAAGHGARHLTGGVQCPPSGIGQEGSITFYSGPKEAVDAHAETLKVLTDIDFRGEDAGLAALYYQIQMDMFWTAMLSWLHALAVADANGITAEEFLPYAQSTMSSLPNFMAFYAGRIDKGEHPGDVDKLAMGVASVEHIVHTAENAGIDPSLPAAVLDVFKRGMTAGHAGDSFTSLIEVFKKSAS